MSATPEPRAIDLAGDDPLAFERFYRQHLDRVLVFFARRVGSAEIAWDLTAETFAVALDKRRSFRGSTAEESSGWLFAIARSQWSHFARRAAVEHRTLIRLGLERPPLTPADTERIERLVDEARRHDRVVDGIKTLPPNQAEAIRQRVLLERDYAAIAESLKTSEQAARTLVSRGLRTLRVELSDLRWLAVD